MENEKLTLEIKQELNQIFDFVAQHREGLFEQNGSIMDYCYETEIVENIGEDTYGIFDGSVIDKLAKVDTDELITYIDTTFIKDNLDNDFVELEVVIELSIIANYWLRENGNIEFFTFMFEALERSEMCGVIFAKELLMFGIVLEALREKYPEYPMLNFTNVPDRTAKVYIPLSAINEYFNMYPNLPKLHIVNEATQTMLVYIPLDELDECIEMYPNCVIDTVCFSNDYLNGGK